MIIYRNYLQLLLMEVHLQTWVWCEWQGPREIPGTIVCCEWVKCGFKILCLSWVFCEKSVWYFITCAGTHKTPADTAGLQRWSLTPLIYVLQLLLEVWVVSILDLKVKNKCFFNGYLCKFYHTSWKWTSLNSLWCPVHLKRAGVRAGICFSPAL